MKPKTSSKSPESPASPVVVNMMEYARHRLRHIGREASQLRRLLGAASDEHCPTCGRKYRDSDAAPPDQRAS